ncbi:MAG TPA: lipopolysaccharide heptosyltransferase II [Noviherbaspirillum sp.]|nr:lipopolysaccharide heptosyltransferase II [Noviherbaspirillum sp.]
MSLPAWESARRILCIRLDHIGDVLMTTPALRALKQAVPGRHITLLTSPGGASVAPYIPEIDDTIAYAAPWMKSTSPHEVQTDMALIGRLASGNFDAAVIFTVYSQNPLPAAMLCYLAGIPLRLAHCHENPYQLLTHWLPDPEPHERIRHEVQRQLDLVAHAHAQTDDKRLSFHISDADCDFARELLQVLGIDTAKPWLMLHPGATAPSRRYPAQHWNAAAHMLAKRLQCPLVFSGSEQEAALIENIRKDLLDTCSLAGQLGLGQLAALIGQAPLLISNNTGPAHIAAAVGTPVIDLYALTNPQHTPWMVPHRVLFHDVPCRNCYKSVCPEGHHDCLARVSPARVADAAIELLHAHKLHQPDQTLTTSTVLAHP